MPRLQPGPGTRITKTPWGFAVGANSGGGASFAHPFNASLGASTVTFTRGLVNGFEPVIKDKDGTMIPISGDDKHAQPSLALDPKQIDPATNESWVCLEVTPYANGTLDAKSLIQVVHRNAPYSTDPTIGRQPLAMIFWNENKTPGRIFQVTYFNLKYVRTTPAPGQGAPQHFFL